MAYVHAPSAPAVTIAPSRAEAGGKEMAFAAICLAQCSEPFFAALAQSQGATDPPGYARIFFIPVYIFLLWAIARDLRSATRAAFATPLLIGLLLLAGVSMFWSIDGGATMRRTIWLAFTMGFGFYLAWRFSWRQMLEVIAGAYLLLIIGSYAVGVLTPSIGVMSFEHPGAWGGLWTHKNTLGGIMALGVPVGIAAAHYAPERGKLWLAVAVLAFGLVLLSTSKTALVASLIGVAIMFGCALLRRGPLYGVVIGVGATFALLLVGMVALLAPEALVGFIGRDLTLTGRTDIWAASEVAVAARPWLGYGYFAFWLPDDGPAYWVREAVNWPVASAHSGWLELALGVGRIGVVLFALQLIATLRRGMGAVLDPIAGYWAPAFLAAFTLYTVSESHVLQANDLFWTLYVAVAARLALDARAEKRKS